jgi:hypothetical protein
MQNTGNLDWRRKTIRIAPGSYVIIGRCSGILKGLGFLKSRSPACDCRYLAPFQNGEKGPQQDPDST